MKKLFLGLLFISVNASAMFTLSSYRVLFDDYQNEKIIKVKNTGKISQIYQVSFQNHIQKKEGGYPEIKKSQKNFLLAEPYLSLSENEFILEPNESKEVKISVQENISEGEYVSYFSILEKEIPSENEGIEGFVIKGNLRNSIPIIVRRGLLEVGISFGKINLEKDAKLKINLKREGNKSIRGKVIVSKEGEIIGRLGNVKLYTNIKDIPISLQLKKGDKKLPLSFKDLKGKKIQVKFIANEEDETGLEIQKTIKL